MEKNYDKYDVFVVQAPTAMGKSSVAKMLMNTFRSVSMITPTNLLVNQFLQEFPDTPTFSRLDSYYCEEWKRPCIQTRAKLKKFCKGCTCSRDMAVAKFQKGPGVYNYHTYLAHKIYREILVVDEAHNLINVVKDRLSLKMWKHDVKYPHNMWSNEQAQEWLRTLDPKKLKSKKMQAFKEAVTYKVPEYVWHRTKDWFNGKGTLRNEPEERDVIKLVPVDVSSAPPLFWPSEVKKIILLSATIGPKDIEQLGLQGRQVCYIQSKSPIPAESRPILPMNIMSVNRQSISTQEGMDKLARSIQLIADDHEGLKGVVHVTYQLSKYLQSQLTSSRYIFHTSTNKSEKYKEFRDAPSTSGKILVACGMYEGMDLPEDAGRWQIIAKIPWGSLASPAVKHLSELDPEWYTWETLKTTIQACGRVCRTPTDYGSTFIIDTTFQRLLKDSSGTIPPWFLDAIVCREDIDRYLESINLTNHKGD